MKVFEANNDCSVYVQYGDVFSAEEVIAPNERRNIVISVNRCFDTLVDDDCVSSKSLHGLALKRIYDSGQYDQVSLDEALKYDLKNRQGLRPQILTNQEKRKGSLERFALGSVAEIQIQNASEYYFFLALSTFDRDLSAHTTPQEYVLAMQRLLEYCNKRSQRFPIVIPLIGAGLSRTRKEERSILEFLVKLLKMNKELITSDIYIVVRNSGKETVSITDL